MILTSVVLGVNQVFLGGLQITEGERERERERGLISKLKFEIRNFSLNYFFVDLFPFYNQNVLFHMSKPN